MSPPPNLTSNFINCMRGGAYLMNSIVINRVIEQLKDMPYELQWRVFEFTLSLKIYKPHGVSGEHLLQFAGIIPNNDLQLMRQAIEENCEQVDINEW